MSFDKKIVFATAMLAVVSSAHAVVAPVVNQPMSSAHPAKVGVAPAVDLSATKGAVQMPVVAPVAASSPLSSGTVIGPGAVVSAPDLAGSGVQGNVAVPLSAEQSHLLLGQINEAARKKVLSAIRASSGGADMALGGGSGPQVPAPILNQIPATMIPATIAPPRANPETMRPLPSSRPMAGDVAIVATMVDSGSQETRVMYSYNGGVYSAALGQKMLNGATAKSVHGLDVTLTDGKRTWTVPVSAQN
ncbi:hypothetical protein [Paraburkholderia sp. GAS32]|uniref:hypothetical protein n=1 Tax=Paraburkholderia sp. GAS32 TaxID=3035129 RepID=UPI003D24538E